MIMIFCHQTMHVIKKKNKNKNRSQHDCLPPSTYTYTHKRIYIHTYSSSFSAFLILFLCFTAAAVSLAPGHGTCLSYYRSLLLNTHYSCGSSPYFRLYVYSCKVLYLYCSTLISQRRHVCVVLCSLCSSRLGADQSAMSVQLLAFAFITFTTPYTCECWFAHR